VVTAWEEAEFKLLDTPVVTLDGTVYRWKTVKRPGRCPCTWAVLCEAEQQHYGNVLCATHIESELTWEWADVPEGARY